jgi:hypothetical protein
MLRAKSRGQRAKSKKAKRTKLLVQQGRVALLIRTKIIALLFAFALIFTGCCAPATTSSTPLPETAFTATFLGFADDGQTLLAKPEQSKDNVQLVYDRALTLSIGQIMYVVGRLNGNQVYVTDLRPL